MAEIKVPLNTGINLYSDSEEVGKDGNIVLENVYIDRPGKITSRPFHDDWKEITSHYPIKIVRWANKDLPFDGDSEGFGWLVCAYEIVDGSIAPPPKLFVSNRDFSSWILINDRNKHWNELTDPVTNMEVFNNVALFTLGVNQESTRYRYINETFWDETWSFNGWFYDIGRPINTFLTLNNTIVEEAGGQLTDGTYYFYKVVPVFDGVQISQLPNNYIFKQTTGSDKRLSITVNVDKLEFNPRCTSFDVYRAENTSELEDALTYYKVQSISTHSPVSNSGGINDDASPGRALASKDSFYTAPDPWSPDDYIAILNPTFTPDLVKFDGSEDGNIPRIRMFNADFQSGATSGVEFMIPKQYDQGEVSQGTEGYHNPDNEFWVYDGWDNQGNNQYNIQAFQHSDPDVNDDTTLDDFATDTLILENELRSTSHHSHGNRDWYMIKREQLIKWGSGREGGSSTGRWRYTGHTLTTQIAWDFGDREQFYGGQMPDGSAIHEKRGCMLMLHQSGTGFPEDNPLAPQTGNNGVWVDVTLTSGQKYYFQYAISWTGSNTNTYNDMEFHVKLTKPNGLPSGGDIDGWETGSSSDSLYYKKMSRAYRQNIGTSGQQDIFYRDGHYHVYSNIIEADETGVHRLHFWMNVWNFSQYYNNSAVRVKDVVITEVIERQNYYCGDRVIIPNQFTNDDPDNPGNALISENDYDGGNIFVDEQKYIIQDHIDSTIFVLTSQLSSSIMGGNPNIQITKGVSLTENNDEGERETISINFVDIGYTSIDAHPTQEIPLNVKYQYSQYIEGRMFVANCRYTNETYDEVEQDSNIVMFSEINEPNIIPVTNFIKVQDDQGGDVTGLSEIMGNLLVFMENSIWRLSIPTADPNQWSLIESSKELGSTCPKSIIAFEGGVFFANKQGVWLMTNNFVPQEISQPWRDFYQDNYDKDTLIHYSPKNRMLYCNQNAKKTTWCLDLNAKDNANWVKLTDHNPGSSRGWTGFMNDETSKAFSYCSGTWYENDEEKTGFIVGALEPKFGDTSLRFKKRTGWIRLGDLERTKMVRRVNVRYKNKYDGENFVPNLKIYADGEDTSRYEKSGDLIFNNKTGGEAVESVRVGVRCKYFSISLESDFDGDILTPSRDLFELLSLEVEYE